MPYYDIGHGKSITNDKTVTEQGKQAVDAYQLNPSESGTMAYDIKQLTDQMELMKTMADFYKSRNFDANPGTMGFMKIATIKFKGKWNNSLIMFEVSGRSWIIPAQLYLLFDNSASNDPDIISFVYTGTILTEIALCKTDISTWGLYVKKNEAHDMIYLYRYNYDVLKLQSGIISFSDDFVTELPANALKTVRPTLCNA